MIHIICFGNSLHGDDGFGPAVYDRLSKRLKRDHVRLFDAGVAGLNTLSLFENCQKALIVDSLIDSENVGRLHWLETGDFNLRNREKSLSSHGLGVEAVMAGLDLMADEGFETPSIDVLACSVPRADKFCLSLSAPVAKAVDNAVSEICHFSERGCP